MARNRLWVLNFDAEDEMATPSSSPSDAVRARFEALVARVGALVPDGDRVYREGVVTRDEARGLVGRAWCPTPRAIRAWERVGATIPTTPAFEVIRRVNHRRFCAAMSSTLPGARYVDTGADLARVVAEATPTGQWLLKRPYGFAGRGRRAVRSGALDAAAMAWAEASLATGEGLQVEPMVERRGDFGLHGYIGRDGAVTLGEATIQRMNAQGAWEGTTRAEAGALDAIETAALFQSVREAARALDGAGYFGPFGVDAFRWLDARGEPRFDARCEINARYSMGWAVGMSGRRPDLDD
ncbi:MAG: hypothetical protein WCJ30_05090 [Deltaproteobacteria bacterium]